MYALLRARVPAGALHELVVTGLRVGGERAADWKIVDESRSPEALLVRAIEVADGLTRHPPEVLDRRKRASHRDTLREMSSE